jgi:hypothetical protein
VLILLMQLVGQSSISCTTDPHLPTPARHLIEVGVDSGQVEVTGWDRDSIEVQISTADARIVALRRQPNHLAVCKRPTGPGVDAPPVTIRLRVPRESRVQVNARFAEIRITGVAGVHVRSRGGRVTIDSVSGRVEAKSQLGEVILRHLQGAVLADATAGSVTTHGVTGTLEVTTNAGAVRVLENGSRSVTISTGYGAIELSGPLAADGRYRLRSERGDIGLRPAEPFNAVVTAGAVRGEWRSRRIPTSGSPPKAGERSEMRFGTGGAVIQITTLTGVIRVH